MTIHEAIRIEENDKFYEMLHKSKLSNDERVKLIRMRWNYLWNKYKPSDAHIQARRRYGKDVKGKR